MSTRAQQDLRRTPTGKSAETLSAASPPPPVRTLRTGKLAGLSLSASIWVLSWPILAESFLNWLVGAVDTVLSAAHSQPAADAIGGAAYMAWFMSLVGQALGVGSTALVSRSIGKNRLAVANAATAQSLLLAIALGLATSIFIFAAAPLFATALNLHEQARAHFLTYLRILALAVPMTTVLNAGIACARGAGDSLRPLRIMLIVNLANVFLSWALSGVDAFTPTPSPDAAATAAPLFQNPFPFNLGVAGIAWGTALSWTIGAALIISLLARGSSGVKLLPHRLKPHYHTTRRIFRIGFPNFLETLGMFVGNFLIIMLVGAMGREGLLGAHIVAIRIEAISFMPGFALSLATATLVGQWLGAGNPQIASRAIIATTALASAFMALMGLAFLLFPRYITALFTPQEAHLELTPQLLVITGFVQIPFAIGIVLRSALRGAGDAKAVMWITWTSTWAIRLPLAWLFCGVDIHLGSLTIPNPKPLGELGLPGLWIGLCTEIVLRAVLFSYRFFQGHWKTAKV